MFRLSLSLLTLICSSVLFPLCFGDCINRWFWHVDGEETEGTFLGTAPACSASPESCSKNNAGIYRFTVTSGDGCYCTSGKKVYCAEGVSPYYPDNDNKFRWLGTAPRCGGKEASCGNNGFETLIALDNSGNGNLCTGSRQKALCVDDWPYSESNDGPGLPFPQSASLNSSNSSNSSNNLIYTKTGVEIGFYVGLGWNFVNIYAFEEIIDNTTNKSVSIGKSFVNRVSEALFTLTGISTISNSDASGVTIASGFSNIVFDNFDEYFSNIFSNYTGYVPYLNLQVYYDNEDDASEVESYLDDLVATNTTYIFDQELQSILKDEPIFGFLDASFVAPYFVEANLVVTDISSQCSETSGDQDDDDAANQSIVNIKNNIIMISFILLFKAF